MTVLTLRFHNTLTRKKEEFRPADPARVTLYVCGPTVYNHAHIGNFRPVIVFDTLFRLLRHTYGDDAVVYARNITDIEDKIIAAAGEAGVPLGEITGKYARIYQDEAAALNALPPTAEPHATGHIDGMIAIIAALIEKGHAYAGTSGVWFHVPSMADYGRLSGRTLEDNEAGARVAVDADKRDAADFALWKFAKPSDPDDAIWDSPWGRGRPGWHIECSAMAESVLGQTIDIHCGGIDLQFPHHENEIAQSECAHGVPMARVWMHNGFLDMSGEKMSKSLGNVVLLKDLLADWPGEVIRFAMLSGHYRAPLDWTDELLRQAKTTLDRVYGALRRVWGSYLELSENQKERICSFLDDETSSTSWGVSEDGLFDYSFHELKRCLADDLNTPKALSTLSGISTLANIWAEGNDLFNMALMERQLLAAGNLLGILQSSPEAWEKGTDSTDAARIDALVKARDEARAARDWAEADRLRDAMAAEGIEVMDGPGGATWRRI